MTQRPMVHSAPGEIPTRAKEAVRLVSDSALSLIDQVIVSGANFMTTVVIGRVAGETELGLYALSFTIVVFLLVAQDSLVTQPYAVFLQRLDTKRVPQLLGHVVLHHITISAVSSLCILTAGLLGRKYFTDPRIGNVLLALATTCFALMLRDFVRRIAFATMRLWTAIALDLVVCVLQLTGLWLLARENRLTAVSAHLWIGASCALGVLAVGMAMRPQIRFESSSLRATTVAHWRFGRWTMLGQLTGVANGYMMHWALALMLGAAQAGVFAACMTLVYVTNPLVIGVGNIMTPSLAQRAAAGGNRSVRRTVLVATTLLTCALSVVFAVVAIWSEQLLDLLFAGKFAGHGTVAAVVTFGVLLRGLGVAPDNGLRAVNAPSATFTSQLVRFVVSLVAALVLIPQLGIPGAAYAMIVGYAAGNIVRWSLFWQHTRPVVPDKGLV